MARKCIDVCKDYTSIISYIYIYMSHRYTAITNKQIRNIPFTIYFVFAQTKLEPSRYANLCMERNVVSIITSRNINLHSLVTRGVAVLIEF